MTLLRRSLAALLALPLVTAQVNAQASPPNGEVLSRGALILRLGTDTMAVETFSRTARRMEGTLLYRGGGTRALHYTVDVDEAGITRRMELRRSRIVDGRLTSDNWRGLMLFDNDSVTLEITRDTLVRRRVAAKGAFPAVGDSYGLYELWLPRVVGGPDTNGVVVLSPYGGPSGRMPLRVFGRDSVHVGLMGQPIRVRTDNAGRLLAVDGSSTLLKQSAERVANVDIESLARQFAAVDAAGKGVPSALGLSPRDTVNATIDGADLWVDYGRPSRRGRDIFANGVLGDTLWRTGANAATQFRTTRPVSIGGHTLPAGTYTLWTRASDGKYELIVNAQTGQWGTQYDAKRDVLRVPLAVRPQSTPVEVFTIAIRNEGGRRGVIELSWDRKALTVPFEMLNQAATR